jgi:hypothetical protein
MFHDKINFSLGGETANPKSQRRVCHILSRALKRKSRQRQYE